MYYKGDLRVMFGVEQPLASCITISTVSALVTISESQYVGRVARPSLNLLEGQVYSQYRPALLNELSVHVSRWSFHNATKRQPGRAKW